MINYGESDDAFPDHVTFFDACDQKHEFWILKYPKSNCKILLRFAAVIESIDFPQGNLDYILHITDALITYLDQVQSDVAEAVRVTLDILRTQAQLDEVSLDDMAKTLLSLAGFMRGAADKSDVAADSILLRIVLGLAKKAQVIDS